MKEQLYTCEERILEHIGEILTENDLSAHECIKAIHSAMDNEGIIYGRCETCKYFDRWSENSGVGYCENDKVVGLEGKVSPEGTEVEGVCFQKDFGCIFHSSNK